MGVAWNGLEFRLVVANELEWSLPESCELELVDLGDFRGVVHTKYYIRIRGGCQDISQGVKLDSLKRRSLIFL